jgi:hypothetical protein
MTDLRKRCQKLLDSGHEIHGPHLDQVEQFAREIRDEALEEACACFQDEHEHIPGDFIAERIRALKGKP